MAMVGVRGGARGGARAQNGAIQCWSALSALGRKQHLVARTHLVMVLPAQLFLCAWRSAPRELRQHVRRERSQRRVPRATRCDDAYYRSYCHRSPLFYFPKSQWPHPSQLRKGKDARRPQAARRCCGRDARARSTQI